MGLPHDFKLATISHIMLGVSDLAVSREFYCGTLSLELAFESPGFVFLNAGGVTLCLSESMSKVGGQIVGATEFVFGVEDVEQAHAALSEKGVSFTQEPRQVTPGQWAANFMDPDGHRLSVFGPKSQENKE